MQATPISITAIMSAYIRAYHSINDNPVIFSDSLALQLIPDERRILIEQGLASSNINMRELLQSMGLPNVVSRARYTEDTLEIEIKSGVKQYVILGAGLDTFAFRHKERLNDIHVFEVDQPNTQEFKLKRLADLGWEIPTNLHFVSADLTQESVEEALAPTPYDPTEKTVFGLLGVTMYLSQNDVFDTLRSIVNVAPTGSSVIFDYHTETDSSLNDIRTELNKMRESMNTTFDSQLLGLELERLGMHVQEDLSPIHIQERYFADLRTYHANENVHLVRCVTL